MRSREDKNSPRLFELPDQEELVTVDEERFHDLFSRLAKSSFRRRFALDLRDVEYVRAKGLASIRHHARAIVRNRLAPSWIANDGTQTPYHGHPVFRAQHATGCCCRGCLHKWHGIPKGQELTVEQIEYICDVIVTWIDRELKKFGKQA